MIRQSHQEVFILTLQRLPAPQALCLPLEHGADALVRVPGAHHLGQAPVTHLQAFVVV